jgi:UDP-galactose transporter B1
LGNTRDRLEKLSSCALFSSPHLGPKILLPFLGGAVAALIAVYADWAIFKRRAGPGGKGNEKQEKEKGGLSLDALPSEVKLLICAGGIYASYLTFGVLQEQIFKYRGPQGERFTATLFLLWVQCLVNALFALAFMLAGSRSSQKIPLFNFGLTGTSYILAMLFSNEALKYVSYPTQALGKSCKMVPVMLFGVLIRGKKYRPIEYFCVFLVTLGITMFQLYGGKKKGGHGSGKAEEGDSLYGVLLLLLSLVMDGVTGAVQDKLKTICRPTVHEFMFYTNMAGVLVCSVLVLPTGQFIQGTRFCLEHPALFSTMAWLSLTSALGQNFIFLTIKYFDALVLTTVTTTRKFFTILVSVVMYGHALNSKQWLSVLLVFCGLSGEVYDKYEKKKAQRAKMALEGKKK